MTESDEADRALGAAVRAALPRIGRVENDWERAQLYADSMVMMGQPVSASVFRAIAEALRKERER